MNVLSQGDQEFQSECFLNASLDPIYIYLSTDSIVPLLQIFRADPSLESQSHFQDDQSKNSSMSRKDYKDLMACIDYDTSKPMDNIHTK